MEKYYMKFIPEKNWKEKENAKKNIVRRVKRTGRKSKKKLQIKHFPAEQDEEEYY